MREDELHLLRPSKPTERTSRLVAFYLIGVAMISPGWSTLNETEPVADLVGSPTGWNWLSEPTFE
jgi:hypothetical protein